MLRRLGPTVRIWLFWLVSRATIAVLILWPGIVPGLSAGTVLGDVTLYDTWSRNIAGGSFPLNDSAWQYPPLAAVVIVAPRLFALTYLQAFLLLAVLMDALVLLLLLRRGDRRDGAWVWAAGVVFLGSIVYLRYDLFVTLPAVAALLALPRQRVFGALAAVGAMLKVWPALLLLGLPRDRRLLGGTIVFAATVGAILAGGTLMDQDQFSFLTSQQNRGMEIEAIAVTPWQIARLFGWHAPITYAYGCFQFATPGMGAVATACLVATLAGSGLVAFLSWRRGPGAWTPVVACEVALAATLVSITTSRVLSPQYLIWVIGIGAACLACNASRQRPVVILILVSALLSQVLYPFTFGALLHGAVFAVLVLVVRNLVLVTAVVLSIVRLGRAGDGDRAAARTAATTLPAPPAGKAASALTPRSAPRSTA